MTQIVLYSNGSQECDRARNYLSNKDGELLEYELDKDFTLDQFISEFGPDATFPQVAVGIHHLGSLKETLSYFEQNVRRPGLV